MMNRPMKRPLVAAAFALAACFATGAATTAARAADVTVQWLGQAAFKITSPGGKVIVIDQTAAADIIQDLPTPMTREAAAAAGDAAGHVAEVVDFQLRARAVEVEGGPGHQLIDAGALRCAGGQAQSCGGEQQASHQKRYVPKRLRSCSRKPSAAKRPFFTSR